MNEIGKRIKQLCFEKQMSYQQLAKRAEISMAALYNLMSDEGNPRRP